VLARYAGHDTTAADDEAWYSEGMKWAVKNGISDGTNPEALITREQMMTMLWRYLEQPKSNHAITNYEDHHEVSEYALEANMWAIENGIINGVTDTKIAPKDTAQRAQLAAIMQRFCKHIAE